ncbi:MAG: DUF5060 domain-containing protein [Gammaproteobacteria bacterium]|nr:DUF5060 domain-containing protein [Gammaproteobacteria bacterium]NNL51719.1 DUF5060 domain-containing protein [Woeseiaceae bacterium]
MIRLYIGEGRLPSKLAAILVVVAALWASTAGVARADDLGSKNVAMWEVVEWQLVAGGISGNPFDTVATVVFTHDADPGANHTTEMFYVGSDTWRFRFNGTKLGAWSFSTSSAISELDGHTGTVSVIANSDTSKHGFLTSYGNKFALQYGNDSVTRGFLFNVFQHQDTDNPPQRIRDAGIQNADATWVRMYLDEAENNGSNVIFFLVMDGDTVWTDANDDPNLLTFEKIDMILNEASARNMHVDFWLWGDRDRSWTPDDVFPGGAMGTEDQRLNRYIAARMGPHPNWTMGYGFDLAEWASEEESGNWANFLNGKLGFDHLIWARGHSNANLDVNTYSGTVHPYSDAVSNLAGDTGRPHHFGERDYYPDRIGATNTLLYRWFYTMAGGHGGHWGYKGSSDLDGTWLHPEATALRTHFEFWDTNNRFHLDMSADESLIENGLALKSSDNTRYIFYSRDDIVPVGGVDEVTVNLSSMNGGQPAIAVDTLATYSEVDLGTLQASNGQTLSLPYVSDWVIAIGDFGSPPAPAQRSKPPADLQAE